ncbi:YdcF family protein [Comamonas sp. Y33R10-2]|uniref:YdcF family protein n=1 Tax=Comamonas sp. Y33R10-2 TaxID=2853257 RepID=UPI001C5CAB40|nr:YdcF family protein [Comamonas sp. Y33R10-2]QXZ10979.1 YdcF family protein [Comamonas sp. Y33R10-2]
MKSEAKTSAASKLTRVCLGAAAASLLINAGVLMVMGHYHIGVVLPAAIGVAAWLLCWKWQAVQGWRGAKPMHARLWALGWSVFAIWLLSLFWFWSQLFSLGLEPKQVPPVQSIVVLGSGTQNGQPRPILAARLDTTAELAKLQPSALIAVCGGVDWGEDESEAEVMARYLQQRHGIAPDRLVLEKLSTSTELNLKLSRPMLAERGISADAPMAMVSSDFHLMRSMRVAAQQDLLQVYPVAAPTPLATRFNAWLREYFAMGSSWLLGEM